MWLRRCMTWLDSVEREWQNVIIYCNDKRLHELFRTNIERYDPRWDIWYWEWRDGHIHKHVTRWGCAEGEHGLDGLKDCKTLQNIDKYNLCCYPNSGKLPQFFQGRRLKCGIRDTLDPATIQFSNHTSLWTKMRQRDLIQILYDEEEGLQS